MRFIFSADSEIFSQLEFLRTNGNYKEEQPLKQVVIDSINFNYQINLLISKGYEFAILDPNGKKHIIKRKKKNEGQSDE